MQPKPSMPNPSKYIIDQNQLQYKVKKKHNYPTWNGLTQLEMDWKITKGVAIRGWQRPPPLQPPCAAHIFLKVNPVGFQVKSYKNEFCIV